MRKLVDICIPKQWKTISTKDLTPSGYPVYGANGVIGFYKEYNHEEPTILITCRGATCGKVNISAPQSYVNGNAMCLDGLSADYIIDFLYYYFLNYNFKNIISGSAQPQITIEGLSKVDVPDYDINLQRRIVDILAKIDININLHNQQLADLDLLVKSQFIEMFGDPVSNPKKWEKVPLKDLALLKIGPFGSLLHKEDYIEGGHCLINPSHIISSSIVTDDKLSIDDDKYNELSAYHLKEGDVVLGRRGEMGRCAVVEREGLLCGTGSLLIRTHGDLKPDFIQKIISFPTFKKTIEDMAVGQTMTNLNVPIVSNFMIIKPPLDVQEKYYSLVEQVDKSKFAVQQSLNELELLKKKLMQDYFG